jgi:hypothetical protein
LVIAWKIDSGPYASPGVDRLLEEVAVDERERLLVVLGGIPVFAPGEIEGDDLDIALVPEGGLVARASSLDAMRITSSESE